MNRVEWIPEARDTIKVIHSTWEGRWPVDAINSNACSQQ